MKNNKILLIIFPVIAFFFIIGSVIAVILTNVMKNSEDIQYVKKTIYCRDYYCYYYKGNTLKYYEAEEQTEEYLDIFIESCKINKNVNKCDLDIVKWDKDFLLINNDNYIEIYGKVVPFDNYSDEYLNKRYASYKKHFKETTNKLKGRFFKNDELEIYFISEKEVVVSNKDGLQEKTDFEDDDYAYQYYDFIFNYNDDSYYFTYNTDTDEIMGFKEGKLKDSKYINLDYINNKNSYVDDISGAYTYEDVEFLIKNNKVIEASDRSITRETLDVTNVNGKYIEYDNGYFIYDKTNKKLCWGSDDDCLNKTNPSDFKIIKTSYYDDKLNLINPNIDYSGAYRFVVKDSDYPSVSEMYIEGDTFYRVDYVEKGSHDYSTYKKKYKLSTRSDNILYFYDTDESYNDLSYNIETKTFSVYDGGGFEKIYTKIPKDKLKYLEIK